MPDEDVKKLIEQVIGEVEAKAKAAIQPEPQPKPEVEQEPDYVGMFAAGDYAGAVAAIRQSTRKESAQFLGPLVNGIAQTARAQARAEMGAEDFDKWWPKAVELGKKFGTDPNQFVSIDQYKEAIRYAKGAHIDDYTREVREAVVAETLRTVNANNPPLGGGSIGFEGEELTSFTQLDPDARSFVAQMGLSPKDYKRSKESMAAYEDEQGHINDLPINEEDIAVNQGRRPLAKRPGRF